MKTKRILLVSKLDASSHPWQEELKQGVSAKVVRITPTEILEAHTFASYDLAVIDADETSSTIVELCKEIRKRFANPLLVLLPPSSEAFLLTLYETGVSECIAQTLDVSLFVAKVKRWLVRTKRKHADQYLRPM
jgi:DNA-binding response OmpR family regulator